MARVKLLELEETSGAEKERYEELAGRNAVTNMKRGLLNDAATYDAYMAWYTSRNRLEEVIGEKDAILYAHSISTTNSFSVSIKRTISPRCNPSTNTLIVPLGSFNVCFTFTNVPIW